MSATSSGMVVFWSGHTIATMLTLPDSLPFPALPPPSQMNEDPLRVTAVHLKNESYVNDDIVKATSMELVNTMKDLLNMNPLYGEQFKTLMSLTGGG